VKVFLPHEPIFLISLIAFTGNPAHYGLERVSVSKRSEGVVEHFPLFRISWEIHPMFHFYEIWLCCTTYGVSILCLRYEDFRLIKVLLRGECFGGVIAIFSFTGGVALKYARGVGIGDVLTNFLC
jgi:hypothetical protein